jgi:hypothetical protein
VLLAGCDDGGGGGDGPELSELPAIYAGTVCDQMMTCYGELAEAVGVSVADCDTLLTATLEDGAFPVWEAAAEAGTIDYDPSRVQACLDVLAGSYCDVAINRIPDACYDVFNGQVEDGGACHANVECGSEAYCRSTDSCPGICVARVAAGGDCEDTIECASGLTCQDTVCALPAGEGDDCGTATVDGPECTAGLVCVREGADIPGTCTDIAESMVGTEGQDCSPDTGIYCVSGLSCAVEQILPPTMTCVAPSASGGACWYGVPDPCPDGEICDADPFSADAEGTCVPAPGAGAPCVGSWLGGQCDTGLRCVDDVCRGVQRIGASCTGGGECYSGVCEGDVCVAPECAG